jgi:hypothetical protein
MNRKPVIDHSLVAGGLLFTTHGDRCRYLGKSSREMAHRKKRTRVDTNVLMMFIKNPLNWGGLIMSELQQLGRTVSIVP